LAVAVAPSWTSNAAPVAALSGVPATAGPLRLATKVHSPMKKIPSRVPRCLPAVRLCRTDSPELSGPFNGIPQAAPCEAGCPTPPRFRSQVFSTSQRLPSSPGLHGLVPCRNRSWDSSLQSFPLAGIAHPSRGHIAPLPLSTDVLGRVTGFLLPPVSPTPTPFGAVAWFPRRLGSLSVRPRTYLPVPLDPERRNRPVPPASPTSKR
jgi:hypothetical protein